MRNSRQRRNISVVILAIGIATFATSMVVNRESPAPGNWFGLTIAALFVSILALTGFVSFQFNYTHLLRLLRGHRRITQWRVAPAEWKQFAADEVARKAAGRGNDIKIRRHNEETGIEVILAEDAILIDDDFFHLGQMRGLQWIPDPLPCLEYNMVTAGKSGSVKWNIRFPVPPDAVPGARAVWDSVYRPLPADYNDRLLRRYFIARALGILVAFISAPALWYGYQIRLEPSLQSTALVYLVVGFISLPVGLFVSVLTHFLHRSLAKKLASEQKR